MDTYLFYSGIEGIDASPVDEDDQQLLATLRGIMEDMATTIFDRKKSGKTASKPKKSAGTPQKVTKGKATAKKPQAKTTKKKKTETSSSEEDEDEEDAYISEEDEEEEEEEEEESEEDDEDDEGESDGDTDGGGVKSTKNPKEVAPEILKKLHMFDHVPPFGNPADHINRTEEVPQSAAKGIFV